MSCPEQHPELPGVRCEDAESPHYDDHSAYTDAGWVWWENSDEKVDVKPTGLRKNQTTKAAKSALDAVRKSDPSTSSDAASRASIVAGTHRAMVMDIISASDAPMSARQIGNEAFTKGMVRSISSSESVRRRALELWEEGALVSAGVCESGTLLARCIDNLPVMV